MRLIKKLTSGMERRYWAYTAISPLFMVFEVLMENTIPLVMAKIVDVGIYNKDTAFVTKFGLLMISMACFSLFCGAMCGRSASVAAFGFSKNLRKKLFRRVQSFSFSSIDKFGTGSLVTRLTTDVTNLQNMYQNVIRSMIRAPLMLLSGTVMACLINIRLASIFFIVIPFLSLVLTVIALKAYPRFKKMFEKYDKLNMTVQENLIAIRVVKAFVRGEFENEKFDSVAEDLRKNQLSAEKIVILNLPVMQLMIYACIVSVLWLGGNMILCGSMKVGQLISFITYITQILMSLMMLSRLFVMFIMTRASISRISEVLDEDGEEILDSRREKIQLESGEIEFNHVYFSYTNDKQNCVLSDINLKIPSGATVGILGGTGSSKTTLVSMIPRLYDSLEGSVKVGGHDVLDYELETLRKSIGVVLQKNVLFSGTIGENLRWGNMNATDEEVIAASKAACAHDFIKSCPNGYETNLGQGGVNLSGGQKQRLCIARAILKNPKILILDDSTSAVDTATDLRIRSALKNLLPKATKIIIAQRIASVQEADFIVLLDDGKINAVGTHDELLLTNEIYKEVYDSQMSKS